MTKSKKNKELILKGIGGAPGITEGKVKKILSPFKAVKMNKGSIAVAEFTTPVLAYSLRGAKAIVCEKGTKTAHAAVVSREWGIPGLVGVENALKVLKNGQMIVVDADEGKIYS